MVREVPSDNRLKPDPLLGDGVVQAPSKSRFDLMKLGGQPPLHGGATDQKLPCSIYSARVSKAEKVEGLWFPLPVEPPAVPVCEATEPYQARFLRVEFQRESPESLAQFLLEASSIILILSKAEIARRLEIGRTSVRRMLVPQEPQ
ncbi:MAG: hypothetical protein DMG27_01065 [Acidobacteria bacterium]|nr:MAG: hypothetical protein DMG27_01065 [Acidobacteriota bacterium]